MIMSIPGPDAVRLSVRSPVRATLARLAAPALTLIAFGAIAILERRRPLRRRTEPSGPRTMRNLAMAGISGLTVAAAERWIFRPVAARSEDERRGLLQLVRVP